MALWFLMEKQIYHIKGIKCFSLVIIPLQAFVSQIVWQTHNYFFLQLLEMISALKRNKRISAHSRDGFYLWYSFIFFHFTIN